MSSEKKATVDSNELVAFLSEVLLLFAMALVPSFEQTLKELSNLLPQRDVVVHS